MLNSQTFNDLLFGGGLPPLSLSQDDFVFDGNSLHNDTLGIRVLAVDYDDLGTIDIETYSNPQIDGGGVLSHLYHKKTVTFTLSLSAGTVADLNTLIDNVKLWTAKTEGSLEIRVNGSVRTCKASRTNIDFSRKYYNLTFLSNVKISFITLSPHRTEKIGGYERYSISGDFYEDLNYIGTAPTYIKYYFVFSGAGNTGISGFTITTGGVVLTINQSIANNDIIIIDGEGKTITHNGTNIDYEGVFEKVVYGSNIITFNFLGGGTVSATLNIIYNQKFY